MHVTLSSAIHTDKTTTEIIIENEVRFLSVDNKEELNVTFSILNVIPMILRFCISLIFQ
jgi:hypothetical protein